MNGKEPKEALDQWLLREKTPDIIVVGIQEIGKILKPSDDLTAEQLFYR